MATTFGSLFAGIGGLDLGLERAGMQCSWQVEIDDYCNRILEKHWPNVTRYRDVRECGAHNLEPVALLAGGFPCQDVSVAGRGAGLAGERSGLWFEFLRVICEIEPRWIVAENVGGLLSNNSGREFGAVLRGLAASGYHATWQVLRASAFGAPHQRPRVFIVANRDSQRIEGFWQKPIRRVSEFSWCQTVRGVKDLRGRSDIPEPLIRRAGNGISPRLDALGNAVVPQVAEWIGRRIVAAGETP